MGGRVIFPFTPDQRKTPTGHCCAFFARCCSASYQTRQKADQVFGLILSATCLNQTDEKQHAVVMQWLYEVTTVITISAVSWICPCASRWWSFIISKRSLKKTHCNNQEPPSPRKKKKNIRRWMDIQKTQSIKVVYHSTVNSAVDIPSLNPALQPWDGSKNARRTRGSFVQIATQPKKYTPEVWHGPWKIIVERLLSFWEGNFSGAMLNFGRVYFQHLSTWKKKKVYGISKTSSPPIGNWTGTFLDLSFPDIVGDRIRQLLEDVMHPASGIRPCLSCDPVMEATGKHHCNQYIILPWPAVSEQNHQVQIKNWRIEDFSLNFVLKRAAGVPNGLESNFH